MSLVTVGIPVWNGAPFLAECINSLRRQSHSDFQAIVAIDHSSDESAVVARNAIAGDGRFTLIEHGSRLGWIGNCNFLLEHSRGAWFSFLPQDDLLAPHYFETLLAESVVSTEASVLYSDLELFGGGTWRIEQESLRGPVTERVPSFLRHHFNAVAFRGMVRGELARDLKLEDNVSDGFAADTLWLLDLAIAGELIRVPTVAYRKRAHEKSMVTRWKRRHPMADRAAWIHHCASCAKRASSLPWAESQRGDLDAALEDRLLQRRALLWPKAAPPEHASQTVLRVWEQALRDDFRGALVESQAQGAE